MKLVDILARELKVWPESWKACAQESNGLVAGFSREDLVHGENNGWEGRVGQGSAYIPLSSGVISKQPIACDQRKAVITRAQWQAAVDALKAEEGMPPIGSHVVVVDDGTLMYGQGESGEVLAHVDGTAVIRMSYGLGCFLPRCLSTKEKIAAEEREREVELAVQMINKKPFCQNSIAVQNGIRHAVGEMIAAGYRKFEIVDKDDGEGEV